MLTDNSTAKSADQKCIRTFLHMHKPAASSSSARRPTLFLCSLLLGFDRFVVAAPERVVCPHLPSHPLVFLHQFVEAADVGGRPLISSADWPGEPCPANALVPVLSGSFSSGSLLTPARACFADNGGDFGQSPLVSD